MNVPPIRMYSTLSTGWPSFRSWSTRPRACTYGLYLRPQAVLIFIERVERASIGESIAFSAASFPLCTGFACWHTQQRAISICSLVNIKQMSGITSSLYCIRPCSCICDCAPMHHHALMCATEEQRRGAGTHLARMARMLVGSYPVYDCVLYSKSESGPPGQ